jgi:hypothetical protein
VKVVRAASLLAAIAALTGCAGDPYPLHSGAPGAGQSTAASVGQAVDAVVLFIELRPGDRLEFVSAEPVGLPAGASVEFLYSPPALSPGGGSTIGERLLPLHGAVAEAGSASPGPANTVGIVARLTAAAPGRYVLSLVRLRYRLNAGHEDTRDGIDVVFTVCADNPAPTDCPPDDQTGLTLTSLAPPRTSIS